MLTAGQWNVIIIQAESTISYKQGNNIRPKHLKLTKTLLMQKLLLITNNLNKYQQDNFLQ